MKISVVLPTYNEKKNIEILIPSLEKLFKKNKINPEIIVVDDSSPDGTADVAFRLNKIYKNIKVVLRDKLGGLGSALRDGYNHAQGNIIISMDSDLSLDSNDIIKFIRKIESGYDLVVGSRFIQSAKYEKKSIKIRIKSVISTIGNKFTMFFLGIDVHDFSLNFRAIKKSAWDVIKTKEKNNAFLLEMIVKSKFLGLKVSEIPVIFKERSYGKSKVKLYKESIYFLKKVIEYFVIYRLLRRNC